MLLAIEIEDLHPSLDKSKVAAILTDAIEKAFAAAVGFAGGSIDVYALESGDDCSDFVETEITSIGCGNVEDIIDVQLELDGREIFVTSVTVDEQSALLRLNEFGDAVQVTVA